MEHFGYPVRLTIIGLYAWGDRRCCDEKGTYAGVDVGSGGGQRHGGAPGANTGHPLRPTTLTCEGKYALKAPHTPLNRA